MFEDIQCYTKEHSARSMECCHDIKAVWKAVLNSAGHKPNRQGRWRGSHGGGVTQLEVEMPMEKYIV